MIAHETKHRRTITDGITVYSGYAKELADNGLQADARIGLCIAPAIGQFDEIIYLTTNGDCVLVGWLEDDEFVACDDWKDVCDHPDFEWARKTLAAEFLA